jgi:non-heme chloroperoxidase
MTLPGVQDCVAFECNVDGGSFELNPIQEPKWKSWRRGVAMRNCTLLLVLFASGAGALFAQDISGDWQGTIKTGDRETGRYRYLLHVVKEKNGSWSGTVRTIDQRIDWGGLRPITSLSLAGTDFKFVIEQPDGSYEGKVSPDLTSIAGTWKQGQSQQLEFVRPTEETLWHDDPRHTTQLITVDKDVKVEVLDWGGSGPPLVLLTGLGNSAHIFDQFAPKLTANYHVYGISRRGFGASSSPESGYEADRLADDVLAVLDALKLSRPVLAGHSIAGEELSSIGSRHPEKVSGLIYLDAGYSYALYDSARGDFYIDLKDLERKLEQLEPGKGPRDPKQLVQDLLETSFPAFEKQLRQMQKNIAGAASPPPSAGPPPRPLFAVAAINSGEQKYTGIRVPLLAIFALPHSTSPAVRNDPKKLAEYEAREEEFVGAQAKAFERLPSAKVVRLPFATHYLFFSNEADVLREMNAFIGSLPPAQ